MRKAAMCILCVVLTIFLISACAGPTRVEKHFGKSFKQARLSQILDPEAERNLEPVTGLDGRASQAGIERYRKSFDPVVEVPQTIIQTGTQVGKVK